MLVNKNMTKIIRTLQKIELKLLLREPINSQYLN